MNQINTAPYTLYDTACDAWHAMLDDFENAKHRIDIDQYILANDDIGHRILDILLAKALSGVTVNMLLDHYGSLDISQSPQLGALRAAGAKIHFYNNLSMMKRWWPPAWPPRNHVKVTAIDGEILYVGSACFKQGMENWVDTTLRITGQGAKPVLHAFDASRTKWWPLLSLPPTHQRAQANDEIQFLIRYPTRVINPIYRQMLRAIKKAKHRICIATPYFMPPPRLRRHLKRAAARGVQVDIILNEKSDVYLADIVAQHYARKFLNSGVNIHLYNGAGMVHAKYLLVDDAWASLGSTNVDYLSLSLNREANIVIRNPKICAQLRASFDKTLLHSHPAIVGYLPEMLRVAS